MRTRPPAESGALPTIVGIMTSLFWVWGGRWQWDLPQGARSQAAARQPDRNPYHGHIGVRPGKTGLPKEGHGMPNPRTHRLRALEGGAPARRSKPPLSPEGPRGCALQVFSVPHPPVGGPLRVTTRRACQGWCGGPARYCWLARHGARASPHVPSDEGDDRAAQPACLPRIPKWGPGGTGAFAFCVCCL